MIVCFLGQVITTRPLPAAVDDTTVYFLKTVAGTVSGHDGPGSEGGASKPRG